MPSTPKLTFVMVIGFLFGGVMLSQWWPRFAVRNAPVVSGRIIARAPIEQWGVPRADFTIALDDRDMQVHAFAQRYLLEEVPETVRFHFGGDPAVAVYLFEHEENPLWIALICWGASLFFAAMLFYRWRTGRRRDGSPRE